jgi:hypothetical protein
MNRWLPPLLALLLAHVAPAIAGSACEARDASPQAVAAAAATALRVADALDRRDAPVALVARIGTDLSKYGLVYSHIGFALRDHPDGRWTVVHLLNRCGTDRSGLYAEGLFNFFADDLVNQDARIVWLDDRSADALLRRLHDGTALALHQPHYNVIARPDSERYQNSTAWALELLASARLPQAAASRRATHAQLAASGHTPDRIRIAYGQRVLGGLFGANVAFTDHPVRTRLSGDYAVVTVRSILRWLDAQGAIAFELEWRDGNLREQPGPS